MSINVGDNKMELNGRDDLKRPLLEPSDSVCVTIPEPVDKLEKKRTVMFKIGNIKCASCVASIESVLGEVNGVESVSVSPIHGQAAIEYVPKLVNVSFKKFMNLYPFNLENDLWSLLTTDYFDNLELGYSNYPYCHHDGTMDK